jgi:hypothetical protein
MSYACGSHNLCTFINKLLITISIAVEAPFSMGLSHLFHAFLNNLLSITAILSESYLHSVMYTWFSPHILISCHSASRFSLLILGLNLFNDT